MPGGERFCEECGAGVGEASRFCPACGAAQNQGIEEAPRGPGAPRRNRRAATGITLQKALVTIALALVGLVVLAVVLSDDRGSSSAPKAAAEKKAEEKKETPGQNSLLLKPQEQTEAFESKAAESARQEQKPEDPDPRFVDGTHRVGSDIEAGTYRTRKGSPGCYYSRLRGFSGELGDIVANDNTSGPAVVTISPTDAGFDSKRCGTWTQDLSQITDGTTSFGDGTYIVGTDIEPGTYRNSGGNGCYHERISGFSGELTDIISNENTNAPAVVQIAPTDAGFESKRCGTWEKIGQS